MARALRGARARRGDGPVCECAVCLSSRAQFDFASGLCGLWVGRSAAPPMTLSEAPAMTLSEAPAMTLSEASPMTLSEAPSKLVAMAQGSKLVWLMGCKRRVAAWNCFPWRRN